MLTDDFKQFVRKVQDTLGAQGLYADTYQLLNIADALYVEPGVPIDPKTITTHAGRVEFLNKDARAAEVREYVIQSRKINAIKEARYLFGCGLKEAKEAVEGMDPLAQNDPPADPWGF